VTSRGLVLEQVLPVARNRITLPVPVSLNRLAAPPVRLHLLGMVASSPSPCPPGGSISSRSGPRTVGAGPLRPSRYRGKPLRVGRRRCWDLDRASVRGAASVEASLRGWARARRRGCVRSPGLRLGLGGLRLGFSSLGLGLAAVGPSLGLGLDLVRRCGPITMIMFRPSCLGCDSTKPSSGRHPPASAATGSPARDGTAHDRGPHDRHP